MEQHQTTSPAAKNVPEEISVGAGIAVAAFATLVLGGALYRGFKGLFEDRWLLILGALAMGALGIYLLAWVSQRAPEWRRSAAWVAALAGFYYAYHAQAVGELSLRLGSAGSSDVFNDRAAAASTSLFLFLAAGLALGAHLLGSRRD